MKRNPYIVALVAAVFVVVLAGMAAAEDWSNSGAASEPGVSSESGMPSSESPAYQEQGPVETGAPPSEGLTPMEREERANPPGGWDRAEQIGVHEYRPGVDTGGP